MFARFQSFLNVLECKHTFSGNPSDQNMFGALKYAFGPMITRIYPEKFSIAGYCCYEGLPSGGQKIEKADRYIWWLTFSDDKLTFNLQSQGKIDGDF